MSVWIRGKKGGPHVHKKKDNLVTWKSFKLLTFFALPNTKIISYFVSRKLEKSRQHKKFPPCLSHGKPRLVKPTFIK